ncbi:Zinc finger, RING-type [Quillaja saponaria]|uniref:RING-type E3 ubiquitin transferase n=1 Tax=Quillaja saponaria TaxID=32244 RepID=A0AAD7Q4Q1_QUISA|nr:Zinc finger, RING-type [Quillaja saponaria]
MVREEPKLSPQNQKNPPRETIPVGQNNMDSIFSPRFKSVAAMAGWDEEALVVASLIVEDTPDRDLKHKKRFDLNFKTPPNNSRRKRRAQRTPGSIPIAVLDLDEEETSTKGSGKKKTERKATVNEEKKVGGKESNVKSSGVSCSTSALPCIDKLREELSCAICLEICFEPSTTPCGHSFCRKCLRSAADKCGKKCPKCRQLISNGRSCTVNTVLWNTIQLLFPQEVEARKAAGVLNSREAQSPIPETAFYNNLRNPSTRTSGLSSRSARVRRRGNPSQDEEALLAPRSHREVEDRSQEARVSSYTRNQMRSSQAVAGVRRRGGVPSQDGDAALALRLQREEFMEAFTGTHEQSTSSISSARANLRAMASRAMNLRIRDRHM